MIYIFDTSSISSLRFYYPDVFPTFWEHFDQAVNDGMVRSIREVYREIQVKDLSDYMTEWIENNKDIFYVPSEEEMQFVAEILSNPANQNLVTQRQRLLDKPVADPFVIAAAKVYGGCVVTQEKAKPNAAKIPNVCGRVKVTCTNLEGFMNQQKWSY